MFEIHVGPVHSTAAGAGCSRLAGVGRGVQPIGQRHEAERQPDTGAHHSTDVGGPTSSEVVVTGHVSVDGQSRQREDSYQAHPIVHGVRQLADEVSEWPV